MTNTTTEKIASTREQIAALLAQLTHPTQVQASRAEVEADIVAQIDTWHTRGAEQMSADLRKIAAGKYVDLMGPAETFGYGADPLATIDTHAQDARGWLTFAIGKEAMLARFKPMLDALPEGIDAAARARRIADIQRQIIALEVREEALLREADDEGAEWDPRHGQRAEAAILIGYGDV